LIIDESRGKLDFNLLNDLNFGKMKRFDFLQSSFLGTQHLKAAVNNEKKRVVANGRKLSLMQQPALDTGFNMAARSSKSKKPPFI
jgi:hypothetical protein